MTDNQKPEQERRRLERHEVSGQVDAVDRLTGHNIGRLVDIHSEGLMLITGNQVEVGNIYQVSLKKEGGIWLEVGVDCLWKNPANGEDRYWAGFRVIDASDDALAQLENLGMEV
ncbi:MAG: PilZ domain-containing protein [Porticoccaceae bacterium]|nr:PilZ domain-containing protein [Porticoccaceae bacterium]